MRAIFTNPAGFKFISFIWMIKNKILKKKKNPAKTASGEALFPPLVKAKNHLQNFEKKPETKKMRNKTFKCYF